MRDGNSRTPGRPTGDSSAGDRPTETPVADPADGAGAEPGSVHVIVHSDRTRIVLSGEIDADLAAELQEATVDAEATGLPIEIDTQHVTFMDSSGIAFLARIATRSADRVRVIRAPETVRFLLEVTRIGELLDLVDDDGDPGAGVGAAPAEAREPEIEHGLPTIGPSGRSRRPVPPGPDDIA